MEAKVHDASRQFLVRKMSPLGPATASPLFSIARQAILLLLAVLGAQATSAEGIFCTRESGFGTLQPGICRPVQYFTPAKWTIDDIGSWKVYFVSRIEPEPAFDSPDDLIAFFVANNPEANVCGTTPYVSRGFEYYRILSVIGQAVADPTGGIAYTDPISITTFGTDLELAGMEYRWVVPSYGSKPPLCDATAIIGPYRRRLAVCPAGFIEQYHAYDPNAYRSIDGGLSSVVLQLPDVCFKPVPYDPKNLGACTGPNQTAGNPVSIGTGNKFQQETDILPNSVGALSFVRYYNSFQMGSRELGLQWRHSYDRAASMDVLESTPFWTWIERPDGKAYKFGRPASGTQWLADADVSDRLYQLVDANNNGIGWRYIAASDETEIYDSSGKLLSITARNGVVQTLLYSTAPAPGIPKAGLLIQVTDSLSRKLSITYDQQARISQVIDASGRVYQYQYDAGGNLASVAYPDGTQRSYQYNEAAYTQNTNLAWVLTGITDENGIRFATFSYDAVGRAISTSHAGGVASYQFSYSNGPPFTTVVTDPLGTQRTFGYSVSNNTLRNTSLSQSCSSCGSSTASAITYDANGNYAAITDFRSTTTTFTFDPTRNLELSRTEASGTSLQRTIQTQWGTTWRLPAQITEPAPGGTKTTTFTYDTTGNLIQKTITAPRNDGTSATVTRTLRWTYGTLGRVLTAIDADSNTTSYSYYPDNDPDPAKRGNVSAITNGAGHTMQVLAYDVQGHALSVTDANGLVTTLTYHPRGWLTSRKTGVELTNYAYDLTGQLTRVTLPDGAYIQYAYDSAHRLTQVSDSLGNKIVYTLDAMGNRVGETAYDPSGQLARPRLRQFDALSRLASDIGAQGQTTAYTYDNNGNLLTTIDPLGHSTGNVYDALNRLTQVLDPGLGVTKYAYDNAHNLTQVVDPRNLATSYKYDGLNSLVQQISPDTGTTSNTYDSTGNLLTKTDARGVTATYVYDGINRATRIVFSNGTTSETHTFQYDVGPNARGRLSQVTDTSGFTNWTYNGQGRVASKSQTVDTYTNVVSYGYNGAGQLTSITTPSGQQIGYGYLNNRISSITVNGQVILQGATTTPFGPITAWRWGNGLYSFRDYDRDGRLATWEFRNGASILRKDQSFDAASRIIGIADPIHPSSNQTYQYDALDRLTVAQTGTPPVRTQQFSYDAVGNRLNLTLDSSVTTFAYDSANNRLQTLSGALPANYLIGSGSWTFTYDNANRLSAVQNGATTVATYRVNALGQRVSKNVGGSITYFMYDERAHLIGEYDTAGKLVQETVWLDDLPVATLRPTGGSGNPTPINIYYVHADHLASPRAVTRPSDNAVMWQWDNLDPFGASLANENPSGQGQLRYGIRFPGQYYDTETGTHYNYHRDYDPTTGRYEQSDPIGSRGGINTYTYVISDPISGADPKGLVRRDPPPRGPGCGPGYGTGIPDNPLFVFKFKQCCVDHDICYDDCKNQPTKEGCDNTFCVCLVEVCNKNPETADFCMGLAGMYCFAAINGGKISRNCGCKTPEGSIGR